MKIGDEVFVHGFVDEIRVDQVIINNRGGYFGTLPDELRTIVMCKDCQHWKWIEWAKEYRCTLRNTAFNARADDFCSYGERRY